VTVVAIHQVLPVFAPRDAIGNHTAAIRRTLQSWGLKAEIFAAEVNPGAGNGARSIYDVDPRKVAGGEPTIWLYHASTGSAAADWWADLPGPKAIDYHNITPAEILGPWEPHIGVELEHGRRQLAELAEVTDWALADSTYNETELRGLGYRWTSVVPILLDTAHLADEGADATALDRLEARKATTGGADWLFVSRLLPHKAQHDLIKALAAYRLAFDPAARLTLVGAIGSSRYAEALGDFIDDLGLSDAVHLAGSVTPGELGAHFRLADVYMSASEHEGFGVPLLEAMAHDVPVVAYAATAVPETVGSAAVLVADKSPTVLATAAHRVVADEAVRGSLVAAGRRRLTELGLAAGTERLRRAVAHMLADAGLTAPTRVVLPPRLAPR
jgi:glycosyltransferase involved in cell wall biosynthesis